MARDFLIQPNPEIQALSESKDNTESFVPSALLRCCSLAFNLTRKNWVIHRYFPSCLFMLALCQKIWTQDISSVNNKLAALTPLDEMLSVI